PPPPPPRRVAALPPFLPPRSRPPLAHQRAAGVLPPPPARLAQVGGDPRRPVLALMLGEQAGDLGFEPIAALRPRRQRPAAPLVEPGPGHPQRPAGHHVRDAVIVPLGGDERGHRYRRIASLPQRATLRLSTSRSIASSAFSLRSRASSCRSVSLSAPSPSPRRRSSAFTQLPRVPSLIPRSRATCAIGLPVSRTSRTAPSPKSRSNFLRVSPIAVPPLRRCFHATRGSPLAGIEFRWAAAVQIRTLCGRRVRGISMIHPV